jgi:Ras-related protein Rab-32
MDNEPNDLLLKVLVIGESACGKTSLIRRYVHGIFQASVKGTIGVDFALKVVNWEQRRNITLQVWDIAGQERYGQMTRVYYQAAVGALVVYDVSRSTTFDAVSKWKEDVDSKVHMQDGQPIPCVLVGNKSDLTPDVVRSKETMDAYCRQHNFVSYFETSAKDELNVAAAFQALIASILQRTSAMGGGSGAVPRPITGAPNNNNKPDLGKKAEPAKKKCC